MNFYEILGIEKGADDATVKAAYRKMTKEVHPDKEGGSEEAFNMVKEAYDALKDEKSRAYYDKHGTAEKKAIDDETIDIIVNLFNTIIDVDLVPEINLLETMRTMLKGTIEEAQNTKVTTDKNIKRYTKMQKKFKKKKQGGSNIFSSVLQKKIDDQYKRVKRAEELIHVTHKALKVLDEYEYEEEGGFFENFTRTARFTLK